jgi:hypothetical protein
MFYTILRSNAYRLGDKPCSHGHSLYFHGGKLYFYSDKASLLACISFYIGDGTHYPALRVCPSKKRRILCGKYGVLSQK